MPLRSPTMLMILDGWGWREDPADNAVRQADTPNFDRLWESCPHAFLTTYGPAVGLPEGQMGNSEVGHLNIGAGRVVMQDLPRIDRAIADGSIGDLVAESGLVERLRETGGTCHVLGLMSPGGVHAHQDHAAALARILDAAGVEAVVHAFTDGRDTPPESADADLRRLQAALPEGVGIATVTGRYFAMDRDNRWDRVEAAYRALVHGEGVRVPDAQTAVAAARQKGKTDEFIPATVIEGYGGMKDGDALLCVNFRADRVREILGALLRPDFDGFSRERPVRFAAAVGMASYGTELDPLMKTLFEPDRLPNGLSETVSRAGLKQLHLAETEKYPHVTYFLNGGVETRSEGEDWIMVPSPKVATYDLQPEMSAPELTEKCVEAIRSGAYDLLVLNFANPDMVGHTGSLPAAITAVETVDAGLGRIADAIREAGGSLLVTADHGNCEMMRDPETGGPHTAHTLNPVPVLLVAERSAALSDGVLADIAPTLLELMGLEQPKEMTGRSLLRNRDR